MGGRMMRKKSKRRQPEASSLAKDTKTEKKKEKPRTSTALLEICISLLILGLLLLPIWWLLGSLGGEANEFAGSSMRVTLGEDSVLARERVVVRDIGWESNGRGRSFFVRWDSRPDTPPGTAYISGAEADALREGDTIGIVWMPGSWGGRMPCLEPIPGVSPTRERLLEARSVHDYRPVLVWFGLLAFTLWRGCVLRGRAERLLFVALALGMLGMAVDFFWRSTTASLGVRWLLLGGLCYAGLSLVAFSLAWRSRDWSWYDPSFPEVESWSRSMKVFAWHLVLFVVSFGLMLFLLSVGAPFWLAVPFLLYVFASPLTTALVAIVCLVDLLTGRKEALIPMLLCVVYAVGSLLFLIEMWPGWIGDLIR